jgi:Tfp pilus assembly protein PilO
LIRSKKNLIRALLALVLLADLVLVGIIWHMGTTPQGPKNGLTLLRRQHALLAADVARAEKIRAELPQVRSQGNIFFNQDLRPLGSGYSALISDLGVLAKESGLQAENFSFHQHEADKRGVVELNISTVVNGDYPSLVRFINSLERSDNFYVLDGLSLAANTNNSTQLKLNLQLRTFFRTT